MALPPSLTDAELNLPMGSLFRDQPPYRPPAPSSYFAQPTSPLSDLMYKPVPKKGMTLQQLMASTQGNPPSAAPAFDPSKHKPMSDAEFAAWEMKKFGSVSGQYGDNEGDGTNKPPPDTYYGYYPNQKYIDKNQKPEQISKTALSELAAAQRLAVKNGYLSPTLAQKFMPNVLVEGMSGYMPNRPKDWDSESEEWGMPGQSNVTMGVDPIRYPPDAKFESRLKTMGISVTDGVKRGNMNVGVDPKADLIRLPGVGYDIQNTNPKMGARLAALMLAKKADLYGEDMAIERWNGAGKYAKNHVAKFEAMQQMLQHPKNKQLMDTYNQFLNAQGQ